eukprot:7045840-Alexandrium_andersonii.AAC.1
MSARPRPAGACCARLDLARCTYPLLLRSHPTSRMMGPSPSPSRYWRPCETLATRSATCTGGCTTSLLDRPHAPTSWLSTL